MLGDLEHVKLLEHQREIVRKRFKTQQQTEQAVAKKTEKCRQSFRAHERRKQCCLFQIPSQKTGMTFWLNRIGEPPNTRVPEENKGTRVKSLKTDEYENNRWRAHAVNGFIYWMKRDDTKRLAKSMLRVRTDKSHLRSCNSLGSYELDWGRFTL